MNGRVTARASFLEDERAISAVEFALILPIALMLYLGLVVLALGQRASQKLDLVAHSLSDLAAQQLTGGSVSGQAGMTETQIQSIFSAATTLMAPYSATGLQMTISEVTVAADASQASGYRASVNWSIAKNSGSLRPCTIGGAARLNAADTRPVDPNSMPTSYTTAKTISLTNADGSKTSVTVAPTVGSIIVADVIYPYQPARGFARFNWLPTAITLARTSYSPVRNTFSPNHIQYFMTTGTNCSASP